MDILKYNREAWNKAVDDGWEWTIPVEPEKVERARKGDLEVILTPRKAVPKRWLPELSGCKVLCLASAGGQQAPLLAAAGARVTSFDLSPKQLAQDAFVAEREGLSLEGDHAKVGAGIFAKTA